MRILKKPVISVTLIYLSVLLFSHNLQGQQIIRSFNDIGEGIEFNGSYYFAASDNEYGMELWATDGTNEGTRLVKDIFPGRDGSHPGKFFVFNNLLFFNADNGKHGRKYG